MKFNQQPNSSPVTPEQGKKQIQVHERIDLPDLHPMFKLIYEKAQEGFEKERTRMEEFDNRKDLLHDLALVNEKLKRIKETILKGTEEERMAIVQSDVFEHMLHKHIEGAHWFGENIKSILPSVYDDLFNGVDLILQENLGKGAFAFSTLAIDATFSPVGAVTKMEHTRNRLLKGKLGSVKYFKSVDMNFTGRVDDVAQFVIGVGRQSLFEMVKEYVQKGAEPGINNGPQKMVLEQIIAQAKYYAHILREKNFIKQADTYTHIEERMSALLTTLPPSEERKEKDEVHNAILAFCAKREQQ